MKAEDQHFIFEHRVKETAILKIDMHEEESLEHAVERFVKWYNKENGQEKSSLKEILAHEQIKDISVSDIDGFISGYIESDSTIEEKVQAMKNIFKRIYCDTINEVAEVYEKVYKIAMKETYPERNERKAMMKDIADKYQLRLSPAPDSGLVYFF